VADWLMPQLSPANRAEVRDRFAKAVTDLRRDIEGEPALAEGDQLGLPSRTQSLHLFGRLVDELWSTEIRSSDGSEA
jgi:hypothetical protein